MNDIVSNQASSLHESVSAVTEISSMVHKSDEAANRSLEISVASTEKSNLGKKAVESMLNSIDRIDHSNKVITEKIQKSNEEISSVVDLISEIGDKTNVINDIVFQTKLLSFNASVEAARAGEHGKGFAVVAEEIGSLANMSGKAALEISDMLENSIRDVTTIVENTKKQIEKLVTEAKITVDEGIMRSKECGKALDDIIENVKMVDSRVNEIACSSTEQAMAIKEVNIAMNELDTLTSQSKLISDQNLSMSKNLYGQTDKVEQVISDLASLVSNKRGQDKSLSKESKAKDMGKVVSLNTKLNVEEHDYKDIPAADDSRFEDL